MAGFLLLLSLASLAFAQNADLPYAPLTSAYEALRTKQYDRAVAAFEQAVTLAPERASIRKDFGYALLKIGESVAARDQFGAAMRLDPADAHIALEYAFLCYETKLQVIARRIFDDLRKSRGKSPDDDIRGSAAEAFENIDRPLREGIDRWQQAIALSPGNFSAHEELARLAEQRDQQDLAAEQYEKSWRLRPDRRDLLLDLGRVWLALKRTEDAASALLAASRGASPRVAEQARELLPPRYPYISEFERALALDPANIELRRELAYLELQMNRTADAQREFEEVLRRAPGDRLSLMQLGRGDAVRQPQPLRERVAQSTPPEPGATSPKEVTDPKDMADKSLEKGYLQDAVKFLSIAHEKDPVDFDVMLKLGWTYNILKDDRDAVKWFDLARRSPDSRMAAEASEAYRNLEPSLRRFRTTVWVFPTFSTRWHDLFAYSQTKTELRLPGWWLHPYASVRLVADPHPAVRPGLGLAPQYLSENSAIVALGVATMARRGATAWFEAGESFHFRPAPLDVSTAIPDYRGGLSFVKGFGTGRQFVDTNDDLVYVHRFDNDTLAYSQNRWGVRLSRMQLYWNWNVTVDLKREYWANFAETGPGVRFSFAALPTAQFSVNAVKGAYLVNQGNPHGPDFYDLRIGVWYAFTR